MSDNIYGCDTHDDDYYAFMNVSKTATSEDIRNAYKSLSKRFHPDKHADPTLKLAAESMFNRLKKVYDVLSDPQKRAIYDTLGASGIEGDAWALVERKFKSAQEIKTEFETMQREKEERRMQQRTNPKGNITVLIDASDIFEHYEEDEKGMIRSSGLFWPTVEVRSMNIAQSIEAPVTSENNVILSGNLSVRNGIGSGTVSTSLRHILSSSSWCEMEFGAGQGPIISAKYFHSISEDIHASAQTYFHITPFGIRPGICLVLTRQFNKNFIGYMSWKTGGNSSLATVVVYENELCRVNGSISFGFQSSYISSSYTHKFKERDGQAKVGLKVGTMGAMIEYGFEAKVSQNSILGAAMSVGTLTGVALRVRFSRHQQNYIFPIILSEDILPSSIFYGTAIPILGFYFVKNFFVDPYFAKKEAADLAAQKENNANRISDKRREAITYRHLMQESYQRTVDRETAANGLIIERAVYGDTSTVFQYGNDTRPIPDSADAFDVTVAVQVMLAENGTLIFSDAAKCYLPGFFDCNFGRPKQLLVRYRFHNVTYQVLLDEREAAVLPSESHRLRR